MNRFILLLSKLGIGALILVSTSCDNKTNGNFTVAVNYKNATAGKRLVLDEILLGSDMRPVFLDSVAITAADGNALLKGSGKEESIYRLMVENGPVVLLINDVKKINLTIDVTKPDDYYTVAGSEASKQLQEFINQYSARSFTINKAFAQIDSLKQMNGSDSLLIVATNNKNSSIELLNEYMESFIDKSTHPAVSLFALSVAARSFAKEKFEKRYDITLKQFPGHTALAQFKTNYDMQQVQIAESKAQQQSNWKGKQLPEFALPSTEGALVKLSSFKGKYVLIDFWASWCGPCRMENPNVVNAYKQFKNKNFTIVGVSLDKQKEPWLQAIKDDKLDWTHISDLKYWNSSAVEVFKFGGIPYNVLVDPKGVVIAENLRGAELESTLKNVLK